MAFVCEAIRADHVDDVCNGCSRDYGGWLWGCWRCESVGYVGVGVQYGNVVDMATVSAERPGWTLRERKRMPTHESACTPYNALVGRALCVVVYERMCVVLGFMAAGVECMSMSGANDDVLSEAVTNSRN